MKKKLTFLLIFFVLALFLTCNTFADEQPLSSNYIGTYVVEVPVDDSIKVYINSQLKSIVEEKGISVYEEKTGLFSRKYYYYANKHVNRIVDSIRLSNDIDSLIFVLNELEDKAKEEKPSDYINLVLGYIRSINKNYDQNHLNWNVVAGKIDEEFIKKVNSQRKFGISIIEYFSQFIDYNDFNSSLHGDIAARYQKNSENSLYLVDPLRDSSQKLDLIHLFACIDGIYSKTNNIAFLGNNAQRDIASWNGDLQQVCKHFSDERIQVKGYNSSNMDYIFSFEDGGATSYDIISDIDAMNITKIYLESPDNSISNSFSGYYRLITSPEDRFRLFIKTVLIDEERKTNVSELERLRTEIYSQFNIYLNDGGYLVNYNYYNPYLYKGFSIMRIGSLTTEESYGSIPSAEIRAFVVDSFYNYIVNNSRGAIYEED